MGVQNVEILSYKSGQQRFPTLFLSQSSYKITVLQQSLPNATLVTKWLDDFPPIGANMRTYQDGLSVKINTMSTYQHENIKQTRRQISKIETKNMKLQVMTKCQNEGC